MADRQCLYHPKDASRKRHSCRINRSGDGRHMAEDCMVRSTTNRCVLTEQRRVSRVAKKSQKPSVVSRSAKKLEKREKSQAKRDAVRLRAQEVKLSYDNSVEEARVKVEQARLRLRKAFGVRKNDQDTPEIRKQLNDMRDSQRVAIYNQYKDEMKDFSSLYSRL